MLLKIFIFIFLIEIEMPGKDERSGAAARGGRGVTRRGRVMLTAQAASIALAAG